MICLVSVVEFLSSKRTAIASCWILRTDYFNDRTLRNSAILRTTVLLVRKNGYGLITCAGRSNSKKVELVGYLVFRILLHRLQQRRRRLILLIDRLSFLLSDAVNMHTERFRQLRKQALSGMLDKASVSKVWRKIVRSQLRAIEIKDLYDNYDFNYNIGDRALALKNSIFEGSYNVSTPLIYRLEKKFGVCRHLVIPHPMDALLLQVLVESVADQIVDKQPSKNAFYSRDKHNVAKPHEEIEYGQSFRKQWKKLQKKIYKFNEEKNLLVVTDLSNYYDSIHLEELRKVFVSLVKTNEVVVDLLFKVIEGISWTPDYLPYSRRGLPTANIEAIRLLAHSFLFEIDAVIKTKTNDSFARWMDDFVIGVDTKKEAIALLSTISDMLKSRGLALNLSKTAILNSEEAHYDFQIDQNMYLDSIEDVEAGSDLAKQVEKDLIKKLNSHFNNRSAKYWDKVTKRYITAFGRLGSRKLIKKVPRIYLSYPGLRPNLLFYLTSVGYSAQSANTVYDILDDIDLFDDLSLYQIVGLLTSWEIPRTKGAIERIKAFDKAIMSRSFEQNEPVSFYSLIWFKSKYSTPEDLMSFLTKYRNRWQSDSFLRRQATTCLARLLVMDDDKPRQLLEHQALSGVQGTVSVANQLISFGRIEKLETKIRMYLFPTHKQKIYPLAKFLVLCSLLNSKSIRKDKKVRAYIFEYITDPTYLHWLKVQYKIGA